MNNQRISSNAHSPAYCWSNRFLLAPFAGILFLTLYPFRFSATPNLPGNWSPFLLGTGGKSGPFTAFLNILLFIPFGFGLSATLRARGKTLKMTLFFALIAGALLSYVIEFLQLYIPPRDSGWEDVFTNATGSAVGFLMFIVFGKLVVRILSGCELAMESWLTPRWITAVLLIYFGLWYVLSVSLQKETRLANWKEDANLLVGNEASGHLANSWKGSVSRLQLWDRALPDDVARKLTAGEVPERAQIGLLADYEFSGTAPFRDLRQSLPEVSWVPNAPDGPDSNSVFLDGKSWLASEAPVTALVRDFQRTNQFSVRVVCSPAESEGINGRIVSISQPSGVVNLNLRQEDANLVFWFRNPLSIRRSILAWIIPGVFRAGQVRDILFSYDGSNLCFFIDGVRGPPTFTLGAGTGLARILRLVRPSELEGYNYIYLIMLFLPAGSLLGIAARRLNLRNPRTSFLMVMAFLLPAIVLEIILGSITGRPVSSKNIVLSFCIAVAGSLWVNADRRGPVRNN